ncbi:PREDICTED: transmembrane protein 72 [Gekko japonicus]|uniref:Transmembrane protein 72 n=1 Tax=Gekko japonicus TaxID=146911 RepID=A0ABM1JMI1_GEKJA|nr:PREDICTED: transmembrane protein 72 [Gekko japonicus]
MKQVAFWTSLELSCRLLGVSTGAVLVGVGAQTLLRGQFKSLAVYLLFSGATILVYEAAYFASLLLAACSVLPVVFTRHPCWKEVRRCRPFQKFLAYVLLSVACFLHPVLVWHVTIPGTMLVLSGLAYFLLSKKHKETAANGPLGQYSDSCPASTAETSPDDTEQTYTFLGGSRRGPRGSLLSYARSILTGLRSQEGAVNSPDVLTTRRQGRFGEKAVSIVLSVQDNAGSLAQESTSDTAPILGPTAATSP